MVGKIIDAFLDNPIRARPPKVRGGTLKCPRSDIAVQIAQRLDHAFKNVEELSRCRLCRYVRPILGHELVPVHMPHLERNVIFSPGAREHVKVSHRRVFGGRLANPRQTGYPVDLNIGNRVLLMQRPMILGSSGADEESPFLFRFEGVGPFASRNPLTLGREALHASCAREVESGEYRSLD